jgi:hypothetical protein
MVDGSLDGLWMCVNTVVDKTHDGAPAWNEMMGCIELAQSQTSSWLLWQRSRIVEYMQHSVSRD